jgi:hypothetical protein
MGEKAMIYELTDEEVQESLAFISPISPQQVPASTEVDPWGAETFMVITPLDEEEFIIL